MNGGGEPAGDRLARVFLGRVLEPGDEVGGQWVRERGVPDRKSVV